MQDLSRQFAATLAASQPDSLDDATVTEAHRALVNFMGVALGGADHEAMDITLKALGQFTGPGTAAVLGRRETVDMSMAGLLNGISSHIHDFDDTTPSNYIHPTSPVASALFAWAAVHPISGRDFLHAFALGFDVVTRIGDATYPNHYQAGWHSTGSIGIFGAAVAIGRLLGLDAQQMLWAIGMAGTQASGLRDNFGSMAKGFHPGHAARCGIEAAFLAQAGFNTGNTPLEGPRGFAGVTAGGLLDVDNLMDRFGSHYRFEGITYKPYPCGIVIHPTIELCSSIHAEGTAPEQVEKVELQVAPIVRDLCDQRPTRGLQGKFSIYHAAAIGLVRGQGRLSEFTDEAIADPALAAMRDRVTPVAVDGQSADSVRAIVTLKDGTVIDKFLAESLGNLKRPLSNDQLNGKFLNQITALGGDQAQQVLDACWKLGEMENVGDLVRATIPR
jgi:2-methylcitrate dehydratase PrpD